jgi:hypothetical protein
MNAVSFDIASIRANCSKVHMSCFVLAARRKVRSEPRRTELVQDVIKRIRNLFKPLKAQ